MRNSRTGGYLVSLQAYIFNYHENKLKQQLEGIREEHQTLTNTPNFFFRGQTFIKDNSLPVVALAKELKEQAISYMKSTKILDKDKRAVSAYFGNLYNVPVEDIYYLLPASLQKDLETPNYPKPDYIDEVLDDKHHIDAFKVIDKEALFKLIN